MFTTLRLDLVFKLLLAVLLGGAVGLERQVAGKASGIRTQVLIAVGSCLLMDLSIRLPAMVGAGDPARLAAQAVTGVGFLGAGAIIHTQGGVSGLTSAATIWTVMAMGLTVGAGFYIEAMATGVLVLAVLAGLGRLEHKLLRTKRIVHATVRVKPDASFDAINAVLHDLGIRVESRETYSHPRDRVFELRLVGPAIQFDGLNEELQKLPDVLGVRLP